MTSVQKKTLENETKPPMLNNQMNPTWKKAKVREKTTSLELTIRIKLVSGYMFLIKLVTFLEIGNKLNLYIHYNDFKSEFSA